ncbi:EAL domain-containing protein [Maritimibacter sp. HL-12]|uniref:EAL domain-containing protein n=1 Tax=Maritimibacter sp. HL-12 TaxID=1162418 RepID=UPI000A0F0A00|nr:EAL domain-containing protein [Maritimibacter sp. HL-12]SMH47745.1 EAL domain, c-di-GMP-specific phosphodiesterase class I (or its enzymatically inactive variant) [Maritimibacter sp. HL-12]
MRDDPHIDPADPDVALGSPLSVAVARRDHETMQMVRRAVTRGEVMLAFQSVVRASHPETPAFHEGLIRVLDHTGRIIPAADFIGVVETQELGRQIDTRALELGFRALEEEPSLRLSVNMSARSIGYPRWMQALRQGLERDPTAGERLILEITERTAIVMPDLVQVFMKEMQTHGISFALDDFGAGYTSFRYLKDFYFDILKIDGEFIRGIADNPDNQVIAEAMLSLSRHFDMLTVAESVETLEDAEFLIDAGCDLLQGYFFGAPTVRPWWQQAGDRRRA